MNNIINWLSKHRVTLLLILIALAGFIYSKDDVTMAGNESSRMGTIQCLVDYGTFAIEKGVFKSLDRVIINNHIYGDKPLLIQVLTAIPYWAISKVAGFTIEEYYHLPIFLLNYLCFYSLNLLMFWLFHKMISEKLPDSSKSFLLFSAAALIFSTMLFSYSVSINNHTPAAAATLILLFILTRMEQYGALSGLTFLAGVTTGTLLNFEFIFGGVFGISTFWLIWISEKGAIRWRPAFFYAAGAFMMIALGAVINTIAHGTPVPLYSHTHGLGLNPLLFEYIYNSTFGFKGIFLYMPVLLFVFPAALKNRNRLKNFMLGSLAAVTVLYWFVTQEYGGCSFGFRYLIPVIPIAFYYIVLDLQNWQKNLKFALFIICIIWGIAVSQLGAYNPWCYSWEPHISGDQYAKFKNSFLGNFFCWSFEHYPESALTEWQIKYYGFHSSGRFLMDSYMNAKKIDMFEPVLKRFPIPEE